MGSRHFVFLFHIFLQVLPLYIWRFLRRCPVLNLTFGKTDQAVGHRGGGEGGGRGKKAPPGPVTESYPERANHASFQFKVLQNRLVLFYTHIFLFFESTTLNVYYIFTSL